MSVPIEESSTKSSRRGFLTTLAIAGAGIVALPAFAGNGLTPPSSTPPANGQAGVPTDGNTQFAAVPGRNINEKILNFALTLEILEADLYRQALNFASGKTLTSALDPNSANYTRKISGGGLSSTLTDVGFLYLKQFAYVEAAHRDFLAGAIAKGGGTPVARNPNGYKFPNGLGNSIATVLGAILPLEETGVRAYLGAINYFTDLGLAQTAGTIYSTEARHSAAISYVVSIDPGPRKMNGDIRISSAQPSENTFEYYLKPTTVLTTAKQFFA